MAELLLKIGDGAGYQDGDVLCAFNRRRIRCVHVEHLCHVDHAGFNRDGLRPAGSLPQVLRHNTCQYLFRRVSETTIERHNLWSGEVDVFGSESIDVREYIKRRLRHNRHAIFGARGREYWYGGSTDVTHSRLDAVWHGIATATGRLESDQQFQLWPMGRLDIRHHLAIRTEDFSDEEQAALESPWLADPDPNKPDEPQATRAKRNIRVDWRHELLDDLGVTEAQVLDPEHPVGRDIVIPQGRFRHESKSQRNQSDRSKLISKSLGGRLT